MLASWQHSPARFREDANTEEDFGLGGYRDRLVVELAQNAADAAVRAGVPGRLRLTLTPEALFAANTGEPLTAPGVQALATLRASHKADRMVGNPPAVAAGSSAAPADVVDPDDGGSSGAGLAEISAVVGRFGVGFVAVLTVTDEPEVCSRTGGVRFSRQRTLAEVSGIPELATELSRRSGHVPVLRLPYPLSPDSVADPAGSSTIPDGFDTVVRLPFRDQTGYATARRALLAVDDTLLLALPALRSIEIDLGKGEPGSETGAEPGVTAESVPGYRVLADVETRWQVFRSGGFWTQHERGRLLADRPTEERDRPSWTVTWAVPRERGRRAGMVGANVLHAPTPTDEALSLPALLIASFPLDPSRRRIQPGPLTDRLVAEAAQAYADLLAVRAREANRATGTSRDAETSPDPGTGEDLPADAGDAGSDVLSMVPTGLPVSEFDAAVTEAIRALLPRVPLLPPVRSVDIGADESETGGLDPEGGSAEPPALLAGADAVAVDGLDERAAEVLASVVPNLVRAHLVTGAGGRTVNPAVSNVLGVRRVGLADVVEELAGVAETRTPEWWQQLYDACADLVGDPLAAEALGALPVPLADGRTVHGPRGVLLPSPQVPADSLAVLVAYGMRVAHPEASSPTLERLGARPADPATLLAEPATRAAVRSVADSSAGPAGPAGPASTASTAGTAGPASGNGSPGEQPSGAAVVDAILRLVRSAGGALDPGTMPWLGELPLPDIDGELAPAASLVLPNSPAERLLDPDEFSVVGQTLVDRWGTETLRAVGVLHSLGVLRVEDVDLTALPEDVLDLPDVEDWADERLDTAYQVLPGGSLPNESLPNESLADASLVSELVAIRDLDLVDPDAWPEALRLIGSDPELRHTLFVDPSYTAWWIAGRLRSVGTADPDSDPDLAGLLPAAPPEVAEQDPRIRERLGTRRRLRDLERSDLPAVLDALAEPARTNGAGADHAAGVGAGDSYREPDASSLIRVWRRLAELADQLDLFRLPEAPEQVRVLDGAGTRLVTDAVVVDSPMWLQLEEAFGETGMVAAPPGAAPALAVVFDLPTIRDVLSELLPDAYLVGDAVLPDEPGVRAVVPRAVRRILPEAPEFWYEHDEVLVAGHPVDWWVDADGLPHAATTDGLARGLAWAAGDTHWPARHVVAAVLADPDSAHTVLPESAFD